jgi:hypothetical protein
MRAIGHTLIAKDWSAWRGLRIAGSDLGQPCSCMSTLKPIHTVRWTASVQAPGPMAWHGAGIVPSRGGGDAQCAACSLRAWIVESVAVVVVLLAKWLRSRGGAHASKYPAGANRYLRIAIREAGPLEAIRQV